jgi:hypothetical protein
LLPWLGDAGGFGGRPIRFHLKRVVNCADFECRLNSQRQGPGQRTSMATGRFDVRLCLWLRSFGGIETQHEFTPCRAAAWPSPPQVLDPDLSVAEDGSGGIALKA